MCGARQGSPNASFIFVRDRSSSNRAPNATSVQGGDRARTSSPRIGEAANDPKVARLVYVDAFAPDAGQSAGALIANFESALWELWEQS
jgi:hypothetical protein